MAASNYVALLRGINMTIRNWNTTTRLLSLLDGRLAPSPTAT